MAPAAGRSESKLPKPAEHDTVTTQILVSNLHCPSCVTNIDGALAAFRPALQTISSSIVSHTVSLRHLRSVSVANIVRALDDAGFDVESVSQDSLQDARSDSFGMRGYGGASAPYSQYMSRVVRSADGARKHRDMHVESCAMCRAAFHDVSSSKQDCSTEGESATSGTYDAEKHSQYRIEVKTGASDATVTSYEALLHISGMTCSSCVNKISETLLQEPWVTKAEINLVSNTATVVFHGKEHLDDITSAIDDLGYEASVQSCTRTVSSRESENDTVHTWRAVYSIDGMSCSSCVGKISEAVKSLHFVQSAEVSLMLGTATAIFTGKENSKRIADAIEATGYDSKLEDLQRLEDERHASPERTVQIRVEGMYCSLCPSRVLGAVEDLEHVREARLTTQHANEVIEVTYLPQPPLFTVRDILSRISQIDNFKVSIYHPPSLEERARRLQTLHRRRIALRLAASIVIAIPTFILGIVYMTLVPASDENRKYLMEPMWAGAVPRLEWALFFLSTPVYFFCADVFHGRALREIYAMWRPTSKVPVLRRLYRFGSMDMLISLGTTIAYFGSIVELAIAATRTPHENMDMGMGMEQESVSYFDAVVLLTMFLLIGRLLEAYGKAKTGDAVAMLGKLQPNEAVLERRSAGAAQETIQTERVRVDLLENGDVVRVSQGASPPSDGVIVEGHSQFDESSLTGESKPVSKNVGDEVFTGTINMNNPVSVQVTGIGGKSLLDQIITVVRQGQARRAPIERVADVITGFFVPIITLLAIVVWVVWLSLGYSGSLPQSYRDSEVGGWAFWSLQFAIAVFVIACPCGIGLAAPTALLVGTGLAAKHGILVKGGGEAFQEASNIDCVVLDKTGTLTQGGNPVITEHRYLVEEGQANIRALIRTLESSSSHPLARAVASFCGDADFKGVTTTHVEESAGKGMKGSFITGTEDSTTIDVLVGNEALMHDHGVEIPQEAALTLEGWKKQGMSVVLVGTLLHESTPTAQERPGWNLSLILAASDPLRPEAVGVVRALRDSGVELWMISGDNPTTAGAVASMVGIPSDKVIAGVLPEQKAEKVQYLQRTLKKKEHRFVFGRRQESTYKRAIVAMVGDGINDSPALTVADVGIAIGSGSDVAISSADFVLVSSNLNSITHLIRLSRAVFRRVKFNFAWAMVYNLVALPIAAGVLYPLKSNGSHIRLDPVWASLAMALSSLSVVTSSLLLRSSLPLVGFRANK